MVKGKRSLNFLISITVLFFLVVAQGTLAAELHGTIYTPELTIAKNILVEINTTPHQRMLSTTGEYLFVLPSGTYEIIARYSLGTRNKTSTEYLTITQDGSFTFDLFLLPDITQDELIEEIPEENVSETTSLFIDETAPNNDLVGTITRLLFALLIIGFGSVVWRFLRKQLVSEELDDDLTQLIKLITQNGGRITQKELRKNIPYSEAKISLLITELEASGKIEKIKKGRANIIILKKS